MTNPFKNEPLERTRFHEAGHTIVYWRLFAVIAPAVLATQLINDAEQLGHTGWTKLEGIDLNNPDYAQYEKLIAMFLAGKIAVRMAIEKGLLIDIRNSTPEESELGDVGFYRPQGLSTITHPSPYTDSEHIEKFASDAVALIQQSQEPDPFYTEDRIKESGKDICEAVLEEYWTDLIRLVSALRDDHALMRLRIREIILNEQP